MYIFSLHGVGLEWILKMIQLPPFILQNLTNNRRGERWPTEKKFVEYLDDFFFLSFFLFF